MRTLFSPVSPVSPAPSPETVVCNVGGRALLPCRWKQAPVAAAPHVEWASRTPAETIYEKWGAQTWSAPQYRGRAEIPEEQLATGDCSLVLRDVQLMDGGVYDSYGTQGEGHVVSRVFVRSVRLSVRDHKIQKSVGVGENLVLELHTPHAQRVVFQERGSDLPPDGRPPPYSRTCSRSQGYLPIEWGLLWLRGNQISPRLQKPSGREEVLLSGAIPEDQGFYKVLDQHGLAVSTLLLTVHGQHHRAGFHDKGNRERGFP
ncbi:unnamed protein product [Merluccius merluccius]